MTVDQINKLVAIAFANVPRPDTFTSNCPCGECEEINLSLQLCDDELPEGLAWGLPLLTPAAVRYLMPALIRNCLSENADCDLSYNFQTMLGTPISKSSPPDSLPFAQSFDRHQCSATLEFLRFIAVEWYTELDPPPRYIARGIRNWQHFANCASQRATGN